MGFNYSTADAFPWQLSREELLRIDALPRGQRDALPPELLAAYQHDHAEHRRRRRQGSLFAGYGDPLAGVTVGGQTADDILAAPPAQGNSSN